MTDGQFIGLTFLVAMFAGALGMGAYDAALAMWRHFGNRSTRNAQ